MTKAKPNKKEISKLEAEKIIKESQEQEHNEEKITKTKAQSKDTKTKAKPKASSTKKATTKVKKVSKK